MSIEEKNAYLAELRRLLATLPSDERKTALTYYREYFDDAGMAETERVITELGPARMLAEQILAGYSRDYLDTQPQSSHTQLPACPPDVVQTRHNEQEERAMSVDQLADKQEKAQPQQRRGASVLLTVLLVIIALPLLLPLAATLFGLLIGFFAMIFGLGLGLGGVMLAVFAVGAIVLVTGLSMLAIHTLEALLACGLGLALLGLSLLMLLLCMFMLIKVAPAVLRFLLSILRWPFERKVAQV
ncbi:MAG: hypothetical protein FWG43_06075 [Clostridiales bacterium]|nr:hypothetical protein [Clostridiales bacterium]